MKKEIALLLLLIPLLALAQVRDSSATKRLSVGVCFSPDLSYRTLSSPILYRQEKEQRDANELPKLSFTAGIDLTYRLNSRLALSTGVFYSDRGYRTKKQTLNWVVSDHELPTEAYSKLHLQTLSLPLKLIYNLTVRKSKFYLTAGLSADFFVQPTIETFTRRGTTWYRERSIDNIEYSRFTSSVLIGAGMECRINESFSLKIEPLFRHGITPILPGLKSKEYLYTIGLNVGLFMHFKKK